MVAPALSLVVDTDGGSRHGFRTERPRRGGQEGLVITSGQVQKATAGSLDGTSKTVKKPVPLDEKPCRGQPQRAFLVPPSTLRIRLVVALLTPVSEFAAAEGAYLSEVVPKIIEMWCRVGLTFTDGPGLGDLRIDVAAPLRDGAASPAEDAPPTSKDAGA
jgi:hypothetical protein